MEWISIKEKLPPKNEYVLIYSRDVSIGELVSVRKGVPIFDNPDWFGPADKVTHWMPLPKEPEL